MTGVCIGLIGAVGAMGADTDATLSREAQMKAAYVFNFVKFVEWPPTLDRAIEICVLGADDVRHALTGSTTEKRAGARAIVVRDLTHDGGSTEGCSVFYFEGHTARNLAPLGALTIGDAQDFTREGGIIRLYMDSNRLRFTINVDNAKRSGLQVSSNLLKLATRVEQGDAL